MKEYNPLELAEKLRPKMIKLEEKKVLLASFADTEQEKDIRESKRAELLGEWFRTKPYTEPGEEELNPFRGEPAGIAAERLTNLAKGIQVSPAECNNTFILQVAGCNLRCWYCFVDDANKAAIPERGRYFSAEEILNEFLVQSKKKQNYVDPGKRLNILYLSGGEDFLVPEIILWLIEGIEKRSLQDCLYLWVVTNLSTGEFYWKYLTPEQREKIKNFKNLGVCVCHKGFDRETFQENTGAAPEFFDEQFKMHRRLIDEGLDVYSYLYPVTSSTHNLRKRLAAFIDRLREEVSEYTPLRMATPVIKAYGPTKKRLTPEREKALENQWKAMKIWKEELRRRFSPSELARKPHEVPVRWGR